ISSIGIIVTVPGMYSLGIGRHVDKLTMYEINYGRRWAWVSQILYYSALGFVKTSMVALYIRLASNATHIKFLYAFAVLVFAHGVMATITTIFMCTPISIVWSPTFPVGCIDLLSFNYFNAAFHILTDIMLALLPIPILRHLQITKRRKIGLIVCFSVGLLTIFGTIARQVTNSIALNAGPEFSWHWSAAELCTVLEVNMAIICASVPALRSIVKVHFGGSSNERGGHSYELDGPSHHSHGPSASWRKGPDFNKLESADNKTHIFSKGSRHSSLSNDSEAQIITQGQAEGVMKQTDFRITYEARGAHGVGAGAVPVGERYSSDMSGNSRGR
ncbi:hypothetical protein FQN50_006580, partial [Emmonsiellopsis sp. PD_5]